MDEVHDRTEGESTGHRFPMEQPEGSNFCLWKRAVDLLSREGKLLQEVGKYVKFPHVRWQWSASMDRTVLYRERLDGGEDRTYVFQLMEDRVQTRTGGVYEWNHTRQGIKEGRRHATVVGVDDHNVQLHSTAVKHVVREEGQSFLEVLKSYGDNTWRKIMHCDGNGDWIRRAIRMSTLVISHDGSYMPDKALTVSGAGILTCCTSTGNSLKIGIAERSESASSYRGEILGGILAQLILRAATGGTACSNCVVKVNCDNKGVLSHGRNRDMSLKENQS